MRVKLTTFRAGNRGSQRPGDVIEVPDDEAARLIADQSAVPVAAATERAVAGPAKNETRRNSGRSRRNR